MIDEPKGPEKIDLREILEATGDADETEDVLVVEPVEGQAPEPGEMDPTPEQGAGRSASSPEEGRAGDGSEATLEERHLRLRADFENYRRRIEREMGEHRRHAEERLLSDLLPILDNLDRALAEAGVEGEDPFRDGIAMIHRQLIEVLSDAGLTPIVSVGQPFDPAVHEAVAREESTELPPNTVAQELMRGYRFGGRLLRPAMVKVSVASKAETAPSTAPETGQAE